MTSEELIAALKQKGYRGKRFIYPAFEALVYKLFSEGYLRRYIADALHTGPDNISYALETARQHLEVQDPKVKNMLSELSKHKIIMFPYFEMSGAGETSRIRTTLYIDKVKY